jgi:hypothetical protein
MELINQILAFLTTATGASATVAVVLELILRVVPSAKPLSLLYAAAAILKGVGSILVKAGELLDKVLPQKIKGL